MPKLSDDELIAAIEQHEGAAEKYGALQDERIEALDRYLGKPIGNEIEGRSQVVARDVFEAVEWIKPQLADIFCAGEQVVAFAPRSADDVERAEQESEFVNYVVTQRNPWFEIWYSWVHDALIQKNGYVKAYFDDSEDVNCEKYRGMSEIEYQALMADPAVEEVECEVVDALDAATGMPVRVYNCEITRKRPRNIVRIENVPPENVLVDQNARTLNLQDPRVAFVEHFEMKTISDLRQEGFDVADDINDGGSGEGLTTWEQQRRDDFSPFYDRDETQADPSMRRVRVREVWMRADGDGDGKAELMHLIVVGRTVLLRDDCEMVPIVALCPSPLSHRHYGLSLHDAVGDLQEIRTALLRGALDNQYLAINGRYAISDNVNLDDMLDSRPGGVVRTINGAKPSEEIMPLNHGTSGQQSVPMMEYIDRIAQKRTGVNEQSQGLDPNALNKTATGAGIMMTAAQQRIKFIARIFAETGIKSLFQLVHHLTLTNSRQQQMFELRGKWVPVDPREWQKRNDMVISIALGAGDRVAQLAYLAQQRMMQMEMVPSGLVQPRNLYNTVVRMAKAAGYKDADEFWTDPEKAPPPPPAPPDPRIVVEQMRSQSDVQKFQAQQQLEGQKAIWEQQNKQREQQAQLELQASNDARDAERQRAKDEMDFQLEQQRLAHEAAQKEADRQHQERLKAAELALKKYEADLDMQVKAQMAEASAKPAVTLDANQEFAQVSDALRNIAEQSGAGMSQAVGQLSSVVDAMNAAVTAFGMAAEKISKPKRRVVERDASGRAVGVVEVDQ